MEDFNRSRSYNFNHSYSHTSSSYGNGDNMMQLESYHGPPRLPPPPGSSYDLRSYSASYAQTQMGKDRGFKLKKGKSATGSSSSSTSNNWGVGDPEFQRKKRVASYKMYSVEGKVKGTFRKSFRWLKDRYTHVVYGWW